MRRLIKGFTLAEVLITLGIIGVVASITLPSLSVNITKQQTGPALAKAMQSLETANALALEEGQARTLDQLCTTKSKYFDEALASHILFRKESVAKPYYYYNGTTVYNTGVTNMYTTKDGITFLPKESNPAVTANRNNLGLGYSGSYYIVYVDINGNRKAPNALGKDLFYLLVDTKGTVIPYGGSAYKDYFGQASVTWATGCFTTKKVPSNALSCAGSIADNGFKVIY